MDTIQTYMFNIQKRGRISRKSIQRYYGNIINRDYIRENISEGSMNLVSSYSTTPKFIYAIAQFAEYHGPNASDIDSISFRKIIDNRNFLLPNGMIYFIMPIPIDYPSMMAMTFEVGTEQVAVRTFGSTYKDALNTLISDPYCVSLQLITSVFLDNSISSSYSSSSGTLTFTDTSDGVEFNLGEPFYEYTDGIGNQVKLPFINISIFPLNYRSYTFRPPLYQFEKSSAINNPFSNKYVPFLLDENYMFYDFGEKTRQTSYPLHELLAGSGVYLRYYTRFDLESGFRSYKIHGYNDTSDKFFTNINIVTQPTMILNKDSWEQYYAYNKANYTVGISRDMANIIWGGVSGTSMQVAKTEITGQTLRNNGLTQIYNAIDTNNPQGISSGANTMTTGHMWSSYGKAQAKVGIANTAIQMANYAIDQRITRENVGNAPNDITGGNNAINDFGNNTFITYAREFRVTDFSAVARKVEYYGYSVDEYYTQNSYNGFNDSKIRYYYNVLQMDSLELTENIIIPNDLKADFMLRLKAGIRLWSIHNSNEYIGYGLTYDNVEINNLSKN